MLPLKASLVIEKDFFLLNLQVKCVLVCLGLCPSLFVPFLTSMHVVSPALTVSLAVASAIPVD